MHETAPRYRVLVVFSFRIFCCSCAVSRPKWATACPSMCGPTRPPHTARRPRFLIVATTRHPPLPQVLLGQTTWIQTTQLLPVVAAAVIPGRIPFQSLVFPRTIRRPNNACKNTLLVAGWTCRHWVWTYHNEWQPPVPPWTAQSLDATSSSPHRTTHGLSLIHI